jgi:hypothetical protein
MGKGRPTAREDVTYKLRAALDLGPLVQDVAEGVAKVAKIIDPQPQEADAQMRPPAQQRVVLT